MCVRGCMDVYVRLHNSPQVSAHSLPLTVRSFASFTSPSLSPPSFPHFSLHHSIYSWISCLSWKLMHQKWRVGRRKIKTTTTRKKRNNIKTGWMLMGVLSRLVAALHRQPGPQGMQASRPWFHLPFHFFSFLSSLPSIHPPSRSPSQYLSRLPCFSLPHYVPTAFLFSISPSVSKPVTGRRALLLK